MLLIACANVANLLLARAALRRPEIGVRLAVGAGRWRLIRQLLTESVLLAALGGIVGVLFAFWGKSALVAMADPHTGFLPADVDPSLNWRVLAFTIVVSLLTGVLFGLAPAWRATSLDLATALKHSKRQTATVSRLSKGLFVAQVALSLLLLVGAGLFIRTMHNLVNLGFNQENLLLFALQPRQGGYKEERLVLFYRQLSERLDNLPGVRAATFGRIPLIAHYMYNTGVLLPGETEKTGADHITNRQMVREDYFSTMEIPLPVEIIGVVTDTKYDSQRSDIEPLLYTSWLQEGEETGEMYFALRAAGEPTALVSAMRQAVRELHSNLPVTEVMSQTARSQDSLGQEPLYAKLLSFFGGLALLLAAIGTVKK